jgi:hypothetical protein
LKAAVLFALGRELSRFEGPEGATACPKPRPDRGSSSSLETERNDPMEVDSTMRPIASRYARGFSDRPSRVWTNVSQRARRVLSALGDIFVHDEGLPATDHDLSWCSLSRIERNTIPPSEVEKLSLSSIEHLRPVAPREVLPGSPHDEVGKA